MPKYSELVEKSKAVENVDNDMLWSRLMNQEKDVSTEIFTIISIYMDADGHDLSIYTKSQKKNLPYKISTTSDRIGASFFLDNLPLELRKILWVYCFD